MKKATIFLLSLSFLFVTFTSCSDDNDFPRTGEDGRMSMIKYGDDTMYFSYTGNKISKIKTNETFVSEFEYTNNQLTGISFYPIDDRIADGHGHTSFSREGNTITIQSWGELSFETYVREIELDENDIPVRITDLGTIGHIDGSVQQVREGKYYSLLSYDPVTKNLLKEEIYLIETSEKVASYTFEYADTPGVMSKVNLPLWFFAYRIHWPYGLTNNYQILYFNHSGNLVKKVADDDIQQFYATIEYQYEYNKAGYPTRLNNLSVDGGNNNILIWY